MEFAQCIAVCRSSILAETLGSAVLFASPSRGKRRVFEWSEPAFMDQLQLSTNSDKLSGSQTMGSGIDSVIEVTLCSRVHGIVGYNHQPRSWRPVERYGYKRGRVGHRC